MAKSVAIEVHNAQMKVACPEERYSTANHRVVEAQAHHRTFLYAPRVPCGQTIYQPGNRSPET